MLNFIKDLFSRHSFNINPKYSIGDICSWTSLVSPIVKIINYSFYYDKYNDKEIIYYEIVDINTGDMYADVEEHSLKLLAYFSEYIDTLSPYEQEKEINNYISKYESYDEFWF